jgi:hypothetical protein
MRRENNTKPTLEIIEAKSHWDGDCLIWDGAYSKKTPYMWVDDTSTGVRTWIAKHQGTYKPKHIAAPCCMNKSCVNPEHIVVVTIGQHQKMWYAKLQHNKSPMRLKKLSEAGRRRYGTDTALIEAIRNDPRPAMEVAQAIGKHYNTVWAIQTGRRHKDYSNPFSGLGAK